MSLVHLTLLLTLLVCVLTVPISGSDKSDAENIKKQKEDLEDLLSSFRLQHQSNEIRSVQCPKDTYVIGASIRTGVFPNTSISVVTGIRMICSDRIRRQLETDNLSLGKIYRQTEWTPWKKCPHGFATRLAINLEAQEFEGFVSDRRRMKHKPRKHPRGSSFSVATDIYIVGITLVCQSKAGQKKETIVGFGSSSLLETELPCEDGKVLTGLAGRMSSIITYQEGERLVPSDFLIQCSQLTHPLSNCMLTAKWELVNNLTCHPYTHREYSLSSLQNSSETTFNASCTFPFKRGLQLNTDLSNLKEILFSYNAAGIRNTNQSWIPRAVIFKMDTEQFRRHIKILHVSKLPPFTKLLKTFSTFVHLEDTVTFQNVSANVTGAMLDHIYNLNLEQLKKSGKLKHAFQLHQLIGYCSVFRLYFPILKQNAMTYIEDKVDGINTRISFVN